MGNILCSWWNRMKIIQTKLDGVLIIEPRIFSDDRGYFLESFQSERYQSYGIPEKFVQDNFSRSKKNSIRGLHYQLEKPQGKLVYVSAGKALDVIVDIRKSSPTFAQFILVELNDQTHRQVYIPPGFAHGFCVLSEHADFVYKCTDYYHPPSERGIIWNDPSLQIAWPVSQPILSSKDQAYPKLNDISSEHLFV